MADEQSFQLLSSHSVARAFAYHRLAEGLNRSPTAFKCFVQQYFDPKAKDDRCAQNIDDIGIAAHTADELHQNIELLFQWTELAGFKLSWSKGTFGEAIIDFLGKTISKRGKAPCPKNSNVT